MENRDYLLNIHKLYNLSRYLFLKTEYIYNSIVEKSGITLPQLRVLWIIKSFPGLSLGEIAKIGCWASPTVTKMLKALMKKNLVIREEYSNKKLYKLELTEEGNKYIDINKQGNDKSFALLTLSHLFDYNELQFIIDMFKVLALNDQNEIILDYIDRLNKLSLKIDYQKYQQKHREILESIICFYNLLRTFILNVESNHRKLLNNFNLTYSQLRALWIIEAFPGITSLQLSEINFKSPSTVNLIVKNLYSKGLIYKEKSQVKNSLYLYINEKGKNLIIEDYKINQKNLSIFNNIEKISQEDLTKINTYLDKMNMMLKNEKLNTYIKRTFQVIEKKIL